MNWGAIQAISEVTAALAVIVTLFYLARQIRQSNVQGRRSEIGTSVQQFSRARMAIAENEDLADILVRGTSSYDGLAPTEKIRFENLMSERFWVWHSIWDGIQSDAFESYFWDGVLQLIAQTLKQPGMSEWWERNKSEFPSDYVEVIDRARAEGVK